jgi:phage baseplate assembly protein W
MINSSNASTLLASKGILSMAAPLYRGFSSVANDGAVQLIDGSFTSTGNSIDTRLFDVDLVKQDLLNHFGTRIGERVARPGFGSIIHDLLFDLADDRTEGLVYADAQRIFSEDPRVTPLEVRVDLAREQHKITVIARLQMVEIDMETNFQAVFESRG